MLTGGVLIELMFDNFLFLFSLFSFSVRLVLYQIDWCTIADARGSLLHLLQMLEEALKASLFADRVE
jgi:hypothetical protein